MPLDYVMGGRGFGSVAQAMEEIGFNPNLRRPYYDKKGQARMTINVGGKPRGVLISDLEKRGVRSPVFNATTFKRDEWIQFDEAVDDVVRLETRAWKDLAAANTYGGFDGFSKLVLESETLTDSGYAQQDMDGVAEDRNDKPVFQPEGLPLPITHSGFQVTARELAVARKNGTFDMIAVRAEHCTARCVETVEKTTLGLELGVQYGNNARYTRASRVYGYLNFPNRLTKTNLTTPTGSNPEATMADVLAMRQQLANARFKGPYIIYTSTDWDYYLDNDYARAGGNNANMTLRDRLRSIEDIQDIRRLDFLSDSATRDASRPERITTANPFTMIMVAMNKKSVRAVNGMGMTTTQWEGQGGALVNVRVMCIWVPQLRADAYGNSGILVATTS